MSESEPAITLEQAAEKAARYAEIDAQVATLEARRKAAHARISARIDAKVAPLLEQAAPLHVELAVWWKAAGDDVRKGKKSIELGGCTIGTRVGNVKLLPVDDEETAIALLQETDWGADLLTTTVALNKALIKAALAGPNSSALKSLGFATDRSNTFYIDTSAATIGAGARTSRAQ